ncbi:MAG: AMP-binding protein, partial [Saprospiraceae bacterium]
MDELRKDLKTILGYFYQWEKEKPSDVYLRQPYNGMWSEYTWAEVGQQARTMCAALQGLGYKKGDHIGILSKNCYHWFITDIALMMGGYVST